MATPSHSIQVRVERGKNLNQCSYYIWLLQTVQPIWPCEHTVQALEGSPQMRSPEAWTSSAMWWTCPGVCWNQCVWACENQLLAPLPNLTFSDVMLVACDQPWWEYLHQRNCQMLQIRASPHPQKVAIKHLPAYHWIHFYLWLKYKSSSGPWHKVPITGRHSWTIQRSKSLGSVSN